MRSLNLKRVLITGAARGLGKALARAFAEEGCELCLTDVDTETLEESRAELAEVARCRAWPLDVTDPAAAQRAREDIHDSVGRIDILINNAGIVSGGAFLDVPIADHLRTYRVNLEGLVVMTHTFLSDLVASPGGHLVNIASASGFVGLPFGATYASSKWGVIGFSESIRLELKNLKQQRVAVTTVCPTYIDTGMFDGAQPPKTTKMLSPEHIAHSVVSAVKRKKVWVLEPLIVKLTPFLQNCLPTAATDVISDVFGASTSMSSWRGHPSDPSNGE